MAGLMEAFPSLRDELKDTSKQYTMFVPSDDAFTYMPTHRAKTLSETQGLLHSVGNKHGRTLLNFCFVFSITSLCTATRLIIPTAYLFLELSPFCKASCVNSVPCTCIKTVM